MAEIHEVHLGLAARKLASSEAKPIAQSLPVLVRIVRLGRHENFEIGVPLPARERAKASLGGREKIGWIVAIVPRGKRRCAIAARDRREMREYHRGAVRAFVLDVVVRGRLALF